MPNWDDPRGPRYEAERDRWRRESMRERGGSAGGERRSFGEEPRTRGERWSDDEERGMDPWRRDRYASRFDQERTGYRRYEDAGEAAYARQRGAHADPARFGDTSLTYGEPYGYSGEEYGLEGHPGLADAGGGPGWGFERADRRDERWRNFDWDDPGVSTSQAGYGAQARSHPGDEHPHAHEEFELDYVRWRDEQMRAHDRDYQDWRREQHRQYDEQYRQFRSERQRHFGQAFHEWRSQRSAVGGIPDITVGSVGQGQGAYGDKIGVPGGYNAPSTAEKPDGALDPPGHLSADRALPEFGREPGAAQAASDGGDKPAKRDEETRRR
jgi:hypothetical protein